MTAGNSQVTKEHLNIATIGHVDHGKTTLMAAISKVCAETYAGNKFVPFDKIDKAPEEKARGITINSTTFEFSTEKRHYSATDCPGHQDYIKNMITGATSSDVLILVVAGDDGAMQQTHEHILLAKQINVEHLVIFINKEDVVADEGLLELVKEEMKELTEKHGFKNVKILTGSALAALNGEEKFLPKVKELLDTLDNVPSPKRALDKPFLLAIEGVYSVSGRGTVVTGKIESGVIKVGGQVEIIRQKKETKKTTVTGVEMFNKPLEEGKAGHNAGLLLRGIEKNELQRGDVVAAVGTAKPYKKFIAEVYILTPEEGGRKGAFKVNYRPQFFIRTADITGNVNAIHFQEGDKLEARDIAMPGDHAALSIELHNPVALHSGLSLAIREGKRTIAAGFVKAVGESLKK